MKIHLIKPVSYPHEKKPLYCGYFGKGTDKPEQATCKVCLKNFKAAERRQNDQSKNIGSNA